MLHRLFTENFIVLQCFADLAPSGSLLLENSFICYGFANMYSCWCSEVTISSILNSTSKIENSLFNSCPPLKDGSDGPELNLLTFRRLDAFPFNLRVSSFFFDRK